MTLSEERKERISQVEALAVRLSTDAKAEWFQEQIRLAKRDINDAETWLRQENIDNRPYILKIVDTATHLAELRLQSAEKVLREYGPDVIAIG